MCYITILHGKKMSKLWKEMELCVWGWMSICVSACVSTLCYVFLARIFHWPVIQQVDQADWPASLHLLSGGVQDHVTTVLWMCGFFLRWNSGFCVFKTNWAVSQASKQLLNIKIITMEYLLGQCNYKNVPNVEDTEGWWSLHSGYKENWRCYVAHKNGGRGPSQGHQPLLGTREMWLGL